MKIAVLMGGTSLERSASLQSGQAVCEALLHNGHRICAVDTAMGLSGDVLTEGRLFTDIPPDLRMESAAPESVQERLASLPLRPRGEILAPGVMEACTGADVVFPVLFGRNEEDGHLQALLDIMGRPYTGCSYLGAAIAFDKEVAKRLMRQAGIPTPDWTISAPESAGSSQNLFGLNRGPEGGEAG